MRIKKQFIQPNPTLQIHIKQHNDNSGDDDVNILHGVNEISKQPMCAQMKSHDT